jgi:intraflagellar transport protein 81
MAYLDSDNVNSWHKNVDIRYEDPSDTVIRMGDFLQMLKFKDAQDL